MAAGIPLATAAVRRYLGLQRRATTDALTGLPNRQEFERCASALLRRLERSRQPAVADDRRRAGNGACLAIIDLDDFKAVNDRSGHAAGDRALVAVAEHLRRSVRNADLVGRWGGDEFVVLLAGTADPTAARSRALTIAAGLGAIGGPGDTPLAATVGIALAPADGTELAELMATADARMYAAKPRGATPDRPRTSAAGGG